ncbi:MAG TPA: hypothetical protein VJ948_05480 [Acidimicrobiia bacterium]|nr:hypothetical protein [Acidimicrobiia bacterium]
MGRIGRNATLAALIGLIVVGLSLTVLAAEEGGDGSGGTEVTTTTLASGLTPAVEMNEVEGVPAQEDWTYRYMVPTALALAVVIVLVTAIKYFTDVVRKRYRIIEE